MGAPTALVFAAEGCVPPQVCDARATRLASTSAMRAKRVDICHSPPPERRRQHDLDRLHLCDGRDLGIVNTSSRETGSGVHETDGSPRRENARDFGLRPCGFGPNSDRAADELIEDKMRQGGT